MTDNVSPKITIIVPVYNVERYLRRCLDSIAAQTFTDWECILIDDGSPDTSGTICDEYAANDGRFRVIHQENRGVSAARNAGLDAARGEWIAFVDSDDWVEPDMCESICNVINDMGGGDLVMFDARFSDGSEPDALLKPKEMQFFSFADGKACPLCGYIWNKAYRADFLRENSIRFPKNIQWGEDGWFTMHAYAETDRIIWLPKKLYNYNTENNGSITKTNLQYQKRWEDNLAVLRELSEYVERKGMSSRLGETLRRYKWCSKSSYFGFYGTKGSFDFWRNLFPEENPYFYSRKGFSGLFYKSIIRHHDFFAYGMIYAKSILQGIKRKCAGKRKSSGTGGVG